jgi:membrane protease subunit HflC
MKKTLFIALPVILLLAVAYLSTFTVHESEAVVITQFGRPVRVVQQAGLHLKLPGFLQKVDRFDLRTDAYETQPIQLLLGDKNPIIISCYVAWAIEKPLLFFQSVGYSQNAVQKLSDMITSQLGIILGDYSLGNIINVDAAQIKLEEIETRLRDNSDSSAEDKYGINIGKIGIKRIAYPAIVIEAVYNRMKSERNKEAAKLRAEGKEEGMNIRTEADKKAKEIEAEAYRTSQILRGEGDRTAMNIYAEAYSQDPEFFDFLKSLETYKNILNDKTTLILSTDSELLKYLDAGGHNP